MQNKYFLSESDDYIRFRLPTLLKEKFKEHCKKNKYDMSKKLIIMIVNEIEKDKE